MQKFYITYLFFPFIALANGFMEWEHSSIGFDQNYMFLETDEMNREKEPYQGSIKHSTLLNFLKRYVDQAGAIQSGNNDLEEVIVEDLNTSVNTVLAVVIGLYEGESYASSVKETQDIMEKLTIISMGEDFEQDIISLKDEWISFLKKLPYKKRILWGVLKDNNAPYDEN